MYKSFKDMPIWQEAMDIKRMGAGLAIQHLTMG